MSRRNLFNLLLSYKIKIAWFSGFNLTNAEEILKFIKFKVLHIDIFKKNNLSKKAFILCTSKIIKIPERINFTLTFKLNYHNFQPIIFEDK